MCVSFTVGFMPSIQGCHLSWPSLWPSVIIGSLCQLEPKWNAFLNRTFIAHFHSHVNWVLEQLCNTVCVSLWPVGPFCVNALLPIDDFICKHPWTGMIIMDTFDWFLEPPAGFSLVPPLVLFLRCFYCGHSKWTFRILQKQWSACGTYHSWNPLINLPAVLPPKIY